ncbi:filamentous hemagglutinin N-terminal domain-containing protein [Morganella morganii]|nr:filamentous hemagglutinin N-terminal domain-containing protein [Morganella morganii]
MKKNGLLLSLLVLSPLSSSLAQTTDIIIVNDAAKLSYGENKNIITVSEKNSNLSHIKYDKFNVGSEGVIFNNQAGADTIINEVISRSVSELNGEIRIKGKQAKYTLINPNGIVCAAACSFRNMTSVNLVAGKMMLAGGRVIGRSSGEDTKLIIKNTTKKIANRLVLNGQHIEINNGHVKTDYLQITNVFNHMNGSPLRNSITIDKQSMIKAKEIKLNIMDTDIANYGIIRGNVSGILLVSDIVNEGKISGDNISFTLHDAVNVSGKGKIKFKNNPVF